MCLTVKYVPTTKSGNLLLCKVLKYINYSSHSQCYITPYFYSRIPKNGWLIPSSPQKIKEFYLDRQIDGGYIHAYDFSEQRLDDSNSHSMMVEAYAFNIKAYGNNNDLICAALYIPYCDKEKSDETLKTIEGLLKKGAKLSRKDVVKAFPKIKGVL